jgi:ferric-dicitrate binding protein FerR (iron transport regulator)
MDREKLSEDILAYLDGQLSETEERDLAARIKGDAEAERLLAELMRLHGSVPTVLGEMSGEASVRRPRRRIHSMRPQSPHAMVWILAAVGAAAAVLLIAVLSSSPTPEPRPIARPKSEPREVVTPPALPPIPNPEPPKEAPKEPPKPQPPIEEPKEAPKPEPEKPKPAPTPQPAPPPVAPPPAPKPDPTPSPAPTITAIAKVERAKGEVTDLLPDQPVETRDGEAAIRFPDQTLVELGAATKIRKITNGNGKRITLDLGTLTAQVTKQPAGQAVIFETPHAEARVLGTRLTLIVTAASTRLEVREGRVRLTRRSDGASTDVGAGQFALASEGLRPAAKKIPPINPRLLLTEDFEDASDLWTLGEKTTGVKTTGRLDFDLVPRGQARPEGWSGTGLRTKQAFAPAISVAADVEVQEPNDSYVTAISFHPNQGDIFRVQLRNNRYGLWQQVEPAKELAGAARRGSGPVKERWKVELDGAVVRFLVNDRELFQHKHDLPVSDGYRVDLNSAARQDAPPGTRASFDNVVIEKLRP